MKFSLDKKNNYVVLALQEEKLDSKVAPELKSELVMLTSQGIRNIILDLHETKYADSSGLSALLTGNRLFSQRRGNLILTGLQTSVNKLIEISHLHSVLNILPTVKLAVESLVMDDKENAYGSASGETTLEAEDEDAEEDDEIPELDDDTDDDLEDDESDEDEESEEEGEK